MPVQFEDSVGFEGSQDQPIRPRTPRMVQGDTARRVNRTQRGQGDVGGGEQGPAQGGEPAATSPSSSEPSDEPQAQSGTVPAPTQVVKPPPQPKGIDWKQMLEKDAGMVYHASRAVSDGINHALLAGAQTATPLAE